MTSPEPPKARLTFDLNMTAADLGAAMTAIERAQWTIQVLSDPTLLLLRSVGLAGAEVQQAATRRNEATGRAELRLEYVSERQMDRLEQRLRKLSRFVAINGIERPAGMSDDDWLAANSIIARIEVVANGKKKDSFENARTIFAVGQEAESILLRIRKASDPKVTEVREGSIVAIIAGAGAPTIASLIALFSARAVLKKTRSEASRADAEALRNRADARVAIAQEYKIVAEAEKIRSESTQITVDLIRGLVENGEYNVESKRAVTETLLKFIAARNSHVEDPSFHDAVAAELSSGLQSILFLASRVVEVEYDEGQDAIGSARNVPQTPQRDLGVEDS